MYIGLKEAADELSSCLKHCTELAHVLNTEAKFTNKPILLIYNDGSPDHWITYLTSLPKLPSPAFVYNAISTFSLPLELHYIIYGETLWNTSCQ